MPGPERTRRSHPGPSPSRFRAAVGIKSLSHPFLLSQIVLLQLCLLVGCSGTQSRAPVSDLGYQGSGPASIVSRHEKYRVQKGDTIYSIAWRYDLDFRELAAVNGISKSYRILPGQELRLEYTEREAQSALNRALSRSERPAQTSLPEKNNQPSRSSHVDDSKNYRNDDKQQGSESPKKESTGRSEPQSVVQNLPEKNARDLIWAWPVKGPIVSTFGGASGNKGIDIGSRWGEPVRAAANGRVVYSGTGLRGYGRLIIIKHNEWYLSAYAHNSQLHVKENELVKAGQVIAEVGKSGSNGEVLHFEVRRKGKPINPLGVLPKL